MSAGLGTLTLDLIVKLGGFSAPLDQAARDADQKMGRIERSTNNASNAMSGLADKVKLVAGAVGFSLGAQEILKSVDAYTELQNRLKLVTTSQYDLATATQAVFEIAQSTRSNLDTTAQVYSNFASKAERIGISLTQVGAITKTVSQAVALSGATSESAAAALQQFGQSLASGVFRGDEFNSVAEQAPGLLKALSEGLGISSGALRKMAADGKLTTEVLVDGLSKAAVKVQKDFEKTAPTISQSFDQINNAKVNFFGSQASESAKALSTAISGIARNFDEIAAAGEAVAAGSLAYYFANGAVAIKANTLAMIENRAILIASLEADVARTAATVASAGAIADHAAIQLADAAATSARLTGFQRLTFVQTTLVPLQAAHTTAVAASTAATEANIVATDALAASSRGLSAALLGPLGLGIAVAGVAAAFLLMGDNAKDATPKLKELGDTVEEQTSKFAKLSREKRESFIAGIAADIDADKTKIKTATADIIQGLALARDAVDRSNLSKYDSLIGGLRAGTISTADAFKQLRDQKILDGTSLKNLTVYTAALDDAQKSLIEDTAKQADYAKANNILATSYDPLNQKIKDTAMLEHALQLQRDENGKALKKQIQDNVESAAKIKDPSNLGTAKRSIALQEKPFSEGGSGKVFDEADLKAYYASEAAIDRAKAQDDADKKSKTAQEKAANQFKSLQDKSRRDDQAGAEHNFNERMALIKRFTTQSSAEYTRLANWAVTENVRSILEIEMRQAEAINHYRDLVGSATDAMHNQSILDGKKIFTNPDLVNTDPKLSLQEQQAATQALRDEAIKDLGIYYDNKRALMDLSDRKELFGIQANHLTDMEKLTERYKFEREQIALNLSLNPKQKENLTNAQNSAEFFDKSELQRNSLKSFASMQDDLNGLGDQKQLATELADRQKIIQDALDANVLSVQEAADAKLQIENDYHQKAISLELGKAASIADSTASMFKTMMGEQSGAYKVMFAASKAFAIADSIIKISQGIANAFALPFPANLGAVAVVAAESASVVSNIQAVALAGQAHSGIDSIPREGTYLLDGGERVIKRDQNRDLTNFLSGSNQLLPSSPQKVVIEDHTTGAKIRVVKTGQDEIRLIAEDVVARDGGRTAAAAMANQNSHISKAITRNFNTEPRRDG